MVRRALHAAGLRFRLHARGLPGTPDIVLPKRSTVVFVHGCFWHGHGCPHGSVKSKTNTAFWSEKIAANRRRDARQQRALRQLGWFVETVWECRASDAGTMHRLVARLLQR
jgi:DNA mismatch endonuclease, patch repair protein